MVSRRRVLAGAGAGLVLAVCGTSGFLALNQPSLTARKPWRSAGQADEFRLRALSWAILAPNPHNRQPWLVRLEGEDALTLYCDGDRKLPVTDPFDRQITIGLGAFLELLAMAAAQDGFRAEITPFPEGSDMRAIDSRPVAHIRFHPGAAPDPLFAYLPLRRSNRRVYTNRLVSEGVLRQLVRTAGSHGQVARAAGEGPLAERLRELTWKAHEREMMTRDARLESVRLMRIGSSEVRQNPDGIPLEGPDIALARLSGVVSRQTMDDPGSAGFRTGLAMYRQMAFSARAFIWIMNAGKTRLDEINAGRSYVRANLQATALGVAMHPWSQALQEYAAMADLFSEVHALLGAGQRIQMLARLGYAGETEPAPRWALESRLIA